MTALLTGKQRALWICEADIITVLAQSLTQALIKIHCARLPTFALLWVLSEETWLKWASGSPSVAE